MFRPCHLLWGDISGYGGSRRNEQRVDIESKSTRVNLLPTGLSHQNFIVNEYSAVMRTKEVTSVSQSFMTRVYRHHLGQGASYHRSAFRFKEFQTRIDGALSPEQ